MKLPAWLTSLFAPRAPLPPDVRRENRMDRALRYISGGAMAMTVLAGFAMWHLAQKGATWPLFYMGAFALGNVAIVLTTYGFILGRTGMKLSAGKDGIEIADGGAP